MPGLDFVDAPLHLGMPAFHDFLVAFVGYEQPLDQRDPLLKREQACASLQPFSPIIEQSRAPIAGLLRRYRPHLSTQGA